MRILLALLLLVAASFVVAPTASACHPDPALPAPTTSLSGYYVIPDAWYGGCPHELTFCLQVWREDNGQPGLQTSGANPDTLIVLVCPHP